MSSASATLSANPSGGNMRMRLDKLRQRIAEASQGAGRPETAISLLAVSKTQPVSSLADAYALGLREFGENYLDEALEKIAAMPDDCIWHFIGSIQSNKTAQIARHFSWVHTVDRSRIAQRLNDQRPEELGPINVCVQVNTSGEASKSGISPEGAAALCDEVASLPRLRLRGLMSIPAPAGPQDQASEFARLRALAASIDPTMDTLSMGMSADLESAIAQGSTVLRIGTALFGPRDARPATCNNSVS